MNGMNLLVKQPTQVIVKLNSSLQYIIVTLIYRSFGSFLDWKKIIPP